MAESQDKKIAASFKGFKDDLDAMLDEASVEDFADSLLDDDEDAIERLLMGPGYEDKAVREQALDDDIDALLKAAQKSPSAVELKRPQQADVEQNIDALLDSVTEVTKSNLSPHMDDYLELLNGSEDDFLANGPELEMDVLEHALNEKLAGDDSSVVRADMLSEHILKDLKSDALILDSNFDVDALDILLDHQVDAAPAKDDTKNNSAKSNAGLEAIAESSVDLSATVDEVIDELHEPLIITEESQTVEVTEPNVIVAAANAFDLSDFDLHNSAESQAVESETSANTVAEQIELAEEPEDIKNAEELPQAKTPEPVVMAAEAETFDWRDFDLDDSEETQTSAPAALEKSDVVQTELTEKQTDIEDNETVGREMDAASPATELSDFELDTNALDDSSFAVDSEIADVLVVDKPIAQIEVAEILSEAQAADWPESMLAAVAPEISDLDAALEEQISDPVEDLLAEQHSLLEQAAQPELGDDSVDDILNTAQMSSAEAQKAAPLMELDEPLDMATSVDTESPAQAHKNTGVGLSDEPVFSPDLTGLQDNIVAETDKPQTVEESSETDFLMADFDISSEDYFPDLTVDLLADEESQGHPSADTSIAIAEEDAGNEIDEFASETENVVETVLDESLDHSMDVPLDITAEPEADDTQAAVVNIGTQDALDPEMLSQITSLWAAHDLLKQQFAASATQPASNEYLADELEMLAKEQKIIRRSIDNNNKKIPTVSYVALGLGILSLLLGGGLLTMKLMDSGQIDALAEQNATLQEELETIKHNSTAVNPEEINAALAEVTVKVDALEKQAIQHNPTAQIEELQTTVNELKAGLGNKTDLAQTQSKPASEAEAVKSMEVKAEVVKAEPVKPPPVITEASKPALPKPVVAKPKKMTAPKVEQASKVIATVVKSDKPKPIATSGDNGEKMLQPQQSGYWVANLVSFRQDWYAQGKAAEFARQGVFVQVVPVQVKGETWYRLRSNNFASRSEALSYAGRAKRQLNLTSVWVTEE